MFRDPFLETLHAPGPAPDRAAHMMLYGQFVGSWTGSLKYLDAEGNRQETTAQVHFGWWIIRDSFHWINRDSADNGETWKVRGQFFLQRRAAG